MNVLVTSSRMPFALDEIRKFGRAGHRVFAADTFYSAPGSHSRFVQRHFEVTTPEVSPVAYVLDVARIVRRHAIDLVVPCFEEVFYLARHRHRLPWWTQLFCPSFELLAQLHQKQSFHLLAEKLGLPTPLSMLVTNDDELRTALVRIPRFVARPAMSRGGIDVCANAGPLAYALVPAECNPTPERPWIVQEYVEGSDVCSFTVAQSGRIVAHCSYRHPREIEHAGGIVFESIHDDEILDYARRIVEATHYHGQLGLDFRRGPRGLVTLECNPRPTAGVHLMSDAALVGGVLDARPDGIALVPAGQRRIYASALIRDAMLHPHELPADLAYLFSDAADIYAERGDRLPAVFQVLSYSRVLSFRLHHRQPQRASTKLMAAYFDGISWNGEPI